MPEEGLLEAGLLETGLPEADSWELIEEEGSEPVGSLLPELEGSVFSRSSPIPGSFPWRKSSLNRDSVRTGTVSRLDAANAAVPPNIASAPKSARQ